MSIKLNLFLIVIFSIFATAATVVYSIQRQTSTMVFEISNGESKQVSTTSKEEKMAVNPERAEYKSIPLSSINSALQGSDPADLALNAFNDMNSTGGTRKVEVYYPQPNQALVTITQTKQANDYVSAIKYRVELTTFGRSLLVSSPRVWQIIWAGSQVQCIPRSSPKNGQPKPASKSTVCEV